MILNQYSYLKTVKAFNTSCFFMHLFMVILNTSHLVFFFFFVKARSYNQKNLYWNVIISVIGKTVQRHKALSKRDCFSYSQIIYLLSIEIFIVFPISQPPPATTTKLNANLHMSSILIWDLGIQDLLMTFLFGPQTHFIAIS